MGLPSELDHARLAQALALARQAIGTSDPNPRVGCVIGSEQGDLFGTGSTQQAGGPHAEVMALRAARAAGNALRGATAWVSLEPCAHHGRTPPCCDALVEAGIARVVVAVEDPFPLVAGQGIARLRGAGVRVDLADGPLADEARELNIGFFARVTRGRPWVRVKAAASLDGRTALPDGSSQWITSAEARADGHAWRRRAGAVVTGIGTALADDPRLDVRLVPTVLQPLRVVVDSTLRLPPAARLLQPPGAVLVACAESHPQRAAALLAAGAEVTALPGAGARVDLARLLALLGERAVNEVHVEAGAGLATALLTEGLADELLLYTAPRLLGEGRGIVSGLALPSLAHSLDFTIVEALTVGPDLRWRLRPVTSATLTQDLTRK